MAVYPESFESLKEFFKKMPGIGDKSAERMALSTIELPLEELKNASQMLILAKKNLRPCSVCGYLTDQEVCPICSDEARNHSLICVVEDYKSAFAFEKAGNYKGVYHVLNKLISPMDNIGADDINLSSLVKRVENLDHPELILALKSSIEMSEILIPIISAILLVMLFISFSACSNLALCCSKAASMKSTNDFCFSKLSRGI